MTKFAEDKIELLTRHALHDLEQHLDDGTEWSTIEEFWSTWGPRATDRLRRLIATAAANIRHPDAREYDSSDFAVERSLARSQRQVMIASWAERAFGREEATGIPQRGLRLLEEAVEAFQACGGDEAMAHKLVKFVFEREPGQIGQEMGGVAVTLLALAAAAGLSADEEECREIHRVLSKSLSEFAARNASKNAAGFKIVEAKRRCSWAGCSDPDVCDGSRHRRSTTPGGKIVDHAYLSAGDTPHASEDRAYRGCALCGSSRSEHVS